MIVKLASLGLQAGRLPYALLLPLTLLLTGCLASSGSDGTDPVVVENAVAFIKRPLLFDEDDGELLGNDRRLPASFRPGARLFLKNSASPGAAARDISSQAFTDSSFLNDEGNLLYDVRDLDVSYDGTRLLFAMRAPEIADADDEDQPRWNIWEYDLETATLRRIIASDFSAQSAHDIAPAYLPGGRIVFSSTRQDISKEVLLREGKSGFEAQDEERESPAFVLHTMTSDGDDIEQITFNQSHDLDPTVLADGKIVFSRWDNAGQTPDNGINIYQVNPDGTGLSYLYGRHSHDALGDNNVEFFRAVEIGPRQLLLQVSPFENGDLSSLPTSVDVARYVEHDRTVEGDPGEAQDPLISGLSAFGDPELNGSYGAASPLFDGTNRFLVSWSPCRLVRVGDAGSAKVNCTEERLTSETYEAADPVYGLWLLDANTETQRPIQRPEEGQQFDEAVLLTSRPLPDFFNNQIDDDDARSLADDGFGILHIRSVYDFDGNDTAPGGIGAVADPVQTPPADRPARFVRIEKPVSLPGEEVLDFDDSAFGRSDAQLMREIIGYAPVEPDGSVRLAVPANVAFGISVLDAQGQRITQRHQNWLQVRPGEVMECQGCHTRDSEVPHGRYQAGPPPANDGATGIEFPNTELTLLTSFGETMAETITRIKGTTMEPDSGYRNGVRKLTPDIVYEDEWTNPAVTAKADPFGYYYFDPDPDADTDLQTTPPISQACAVEWSSFCRIVINYETHIHPLWNLDRAVLDDDGAPVLDGNGQPLDYTCTGCHTETDSNGMKQVPAAQLDLTDGLSGQETTLFKAYVELLFNDAKQEVVNGALVDILIDSGEIEQDENGDPILDAGGSEIPILVTVNVPSAMSTNGALASSRFMREFQFGGMHEGFLTSVELKLIAEWLDLGAQYYNNPFDVPEPED
jgi:hypothetical protein